MTPPGPEAPPPEEPAPAEGDAPVEGGATDGGAEAADADPVEAALLLRLLSTLLREDVAGLRTRSTPEDRPDGRWLRLKAPAEGPAASPASTPPGPLGGEDLLLPVQDDGFQCEYAARLPLIRLEPAARPSGVKPTDGTPEPADDSPEPTPPTPQPAHSGPQSAARTRQPAGNAPEPADHSQKPPASRHEPAASGKDQAADGPREPAAPEPTPLTREPGGPRQESTPSGHRPTPSGQEQAADTRPAPAAPEPLSPRQESAPSGREIADARRVLGALAQFAAPQDRSGFDALAGEHRAALDALRLQAATRRETFARLEARHGPDPARWQGLTASLGFDALAARQGHPLYPTGAARTGLTGGQLRRHAPEFAPSFALRWLLLPRGKATVRTPAGEPLADFWPAPSELGGPAAGDGDHLALPVHPLTAAGPLRDALREAGLAGSAVLAERPYLTVEPTLSTRTVAVRADPRTHLKLPLATSTLGLLNRRTIKPGTLLDGAAGQRLLEAVRDREPRFQGRIMHCDETRWAHAGHELLAVLVRRLPPGLEGCTVLPLAALPAPAPDGRPVADHLADRFTGGDPVALLDAVLTLLLDWQVTLFGYGVALESHQQNVSLVLDRPAGTTRVRLLFKDDDGPRVHRHRLAAALGAERPEDLGGPERPEDPRSPGAPDAPDVFALGAGFDDPRITVDDDAPLTGLFTTITVHLCAGALAVALSGPGRASQPDLLGLVRDRLEEAVARLHLTAPGPARTLRATVLDADRLPVKAMLTAGTLLTKRRSGASDINKHYTTGPNYLLREP